ncbi:MAG: von Willebrand factor type A domain-containing protein, partial [Bdellovibrionia bacterium]
MTQEMKDSYLLTAYALGELKGEEAEEMRKLIEGDEDLQKSVLEIRQSAGILRDELAKEKQPHLTPLERSRVELGWMKEHKKIGRRQNMNRWMTIGATAAAAAIAVVFAVPNLDKVAPTPSTTYVPPVSVQKAAGLKRAESKNETIALAQPQSGYGAGAGGGGGGAPNAGAPVDLQNFMAKGKVQGQSYTISGGRVVPPTRVYDKKSVIKDSRTDIEKAASEEAGNTEAYDQIVENDFVRPTDHPLSTFSIDVDTASYANMRRFLKSGQIPPKDAIRTEELLNYFNYDDPQPKGEHPFAVRVETAKAPWNSEHKLVRVSLKGQEIEMKDHPPSNLVFLIDVSGSMEDFNKLPLVKQALKLLVDKLSDNDRVAIVVY